MQNNKDKKVLLSIRNLKQYFPIKKSSFFQKEQEYVKANDGISLDIYEGETVGLVGESGCGKSTFGRVLLQLYHQTAGRTMYYGHTVEEMAPKYAEKIIKHLSENVKKLEHLEGNEKEELYLDIVEIVGGLIVADNLDEVSKMLEEKYNVCSYIFKLKKELIDLNSVAKKNTSKIAEVQTKIDVESHKLAKMNNEIAKYKKGLATKPDFQKHEEKKDEGINIKKLEYEEIRFLRKELQLIFQDPYSSLDPRMTVGQIIGEGLLTHKYFEKNGPEMQDYVTKVMEECGLSPYFIHRYPHEFSGGQRQRIGIARSLALKPKFVVCDEAVSALDVSIQSQVVNLLLDLKEKENLTYLFISHDLSVVKYISDRIGVMYLGNLVELATTEELFENMKHPYTEALLSVIPTTDLKKDKEVILLEGDIPSPIHPPKGCKFHTRCRYCTDICKEKVPEFEEVAPGHFVACHHKVGENK